MISGTKFRDLYIAAILRRTARGLSGCSLQVLEVPYHLFLEPG